MKKIEIAEEIASNAIHELNNQLTTNGQLSLSERERVKDIIKDSALNVLNTLEENIGEFLVRIGVMKKYQVQDILLVQKRGDKRLFGEIAVELGYIDDKAVVIHHFRVFFAFFRMTCYIHFYCCLKFHSYS